MPATRGYLDSTLSSDSRGLQHSLELEFFKEFMLADDEFFVILTVCPIINGVITEAIGIRQYEFDAIAKPKYIVPSDGSPPKNALPASIF